MIFSKLTAILYLFESDLSTYIWCLIPYKLSSSIGSYYWVCLEIFQTNFYWVWHGNILLVDVWFGNDLVAWRNDGVDCLYRYNFSFYCLSKLESFIGLIVVNRFLISFQFPNMIGDNILTDSMPLKRLVILPYLFVLEWIHEWQWLLQWNKVQIWMFNRFDHFPFYLTVLYVVLWVIEIYSCDSVGFLEVSFDTFEIGIKLVLKLQPSNELILVSWGFH